MTGKTQGGGKKDQSNRHCKSQKPEGTEVKQTKAGAKLYVQ